MKVCSGHDDMVMLVVVVVVVVVGRGEGAMSPEVGLVVGEWLEVAEIVLVVVDKPQWQG